VVLPNASPENAFRKAEEIRGKIESIVVRYLDRNLPRISVSIGVAAFPDSGDHPEAVIRAADEALYAAKANGRNCVEAARSLDLASANSGGDPLSLQQVLRANFGAAEQALKSQAAAS
ncbi:MAG TPA: GGDEF domain-containing protein, partial [Methylocystis sp.]|nr:GGDEF domain-containing protein [Methylocystis sp.]